MKKSLDVLLREFVSSVGEDEADRLLRPTLESLVELAALRREFLRQKAIKQIQSSKNSDSNLTPKQIEQLKRKFGHGTR